MKLEPLFDRVLIKRDTAEMKYHGLIHLPENRTEKPQLGTVIAVGAGKVDSDGVHIEPTLTPGDRVMFGKYSGTDIRLGDDEYVIIRETDVIGIVTDEDTPVKP